MRCYVIRVLRKLVTMISAQAQLVADVSASKKQAESATAVAQQLLDEKDDSGDKEVSQHVDKSKNRRRRAVIRDVMFGFVVVNLSLVKFSILCE